MKKITPKTEKYQRPSWDEYFLGMIDFIGSRATCDRGRSGCVIVRDKRIISTGYVGAPPGLPHCDEVGHEMHTVINEDGTQSQHCIRTSHAEQNAIVQAARFGIALDGSTIYCKMTLCYVCAKLAITAGVKRVVAQRDYHASKKSKEIFKKAGVKLDIINKEAEKYSRQ
ncbi:cell division protein DedD [Candidatus Nomurabacteria bacterium RIFCSPLOWO2_02_FULL_40_10]|uniref:Cell division protein DedD n=2 Tax=Candidatus Nomuraibacteriota TaxID=1752729 RepID=A0A1F6XX64_9BACT|nr:MAG: cell division protein DedD [Candidatus Nomurabacteria bacterium RIFCSPHIGHO2_01_FULL_39_10]OGI98710.1 MAG: cell division protein DedD [Candidatus Nomurabacteria bacterium RIFCSPLOWO2_02_FULL_40_10]